MNRRRVVRSGAAQQMSNTVPSAASGSYRYRSLPSEALSYPPSDQFDPICRVKEEPQEVRNAVANEYRSPQQRGIVEGRRENRFFQTSTEAWSDAADAEDTGADAPLPVFGDYSDSAVGSSDSITIEISQDDTAADDKRELAAMFMDEGKFGGSTSGITKTEAEDNDTDDSTEAFRWRQIQGSSYDSPVRYSDESDLVRKYTMKPTISSYRGSKSAIIPDLPSAPSPTFNMGSSKFSTPPNDSAAINVPSGVQCAKCKNTYSSKKTFFSHVCKKLNNAKCLLNAKVAVPPPVPIRVPTVSPAAPRRGQMSTNMYTCHICGKSYSHSSGLRRHRRSAHRKAQEDHPSNCAGCVVCQGAFMGYNNMPTMVVMSNNPSASVAMENGGSPDPSDNDVGDQLNNGGDIIDDETDETKTLSSAAAAVKSRRSSRKRNNYVYGANVGKDDATAPVSSLDGSNDAASISPDLSPSFVCSCGKEFPKRELLRQHIQRNPGCEESPATQSILYDCELCDSQLQFESSLVRHYKEVHNRPVEPSERDSLARSALAGTSSVSPSPASSHSTMTRVSQIMGPIVKPVIIDAYSTAVQSAADRVVSIVRQQKRANETSVSPFLYPPDEAGDTPFQCTEPGCDKTFLYRRALFRHLKECHSAERFVCDICGKQVKYQKSLINHRRIFHNIDSEEITFYPCAICGDKFRYESSLVTHKREVHKMKITEMRSGVSGMSAKPVLSTKSSLNNNKALPSQSPTKAPNTSAVPYANGVVASGKIKKTLRKGRKRPLYGSKVTFKCSIPNCGQTFIHQRSLENHEQDFHSTQRYPCDICGKEIKYLRYMKYHKKLFHGIDPDATVYHCSECGEEFRYESSLVTHKKMVHQMEDQMTFAQQHQLSLMEEEALSRSPGSSEMENEFEEEEMEETPPSPPQPTVRSARIKSRLGDKSADEAESSSSNYFFECSFPGCDKKFKTSSSLHVHERYGSTHSEPQFPCDICGKQLRYMNNLRYHKRSVHGIS